MQLRLVDEKIDWIYSGCAAKTVAVLRVLKFVKQQASCHAAIIFAPVATTTSTMLNKHDSK